MEATESLELRKGMETYLLLLRADTTGSLGVLTTSSDTLAIQQEAVDALGGAVVAYWAALGRFDAAMLVQFPSAEPALSWSLLTNSAGLYTEAIRLFDLDAIAHARELSDGIARLPEARDETAG